ncbi:hypothetical protein KLP28_09420 [Nocardioidaceae bacterium]|nr:hypothetical protein KLP28_09420 [Nocardioidaceae bacterium]
MTTTKRAVGATIATAVAGTMLMGVPQTAQAAPGDRYVPPAPARVVVNVPRPALGKSNAINVQLVSDAGRPKGLVVVRVRRQNGKIIAKRTCRTRSDSQCTIRFKAPKRGRAGFVTVRYLGNANYENDVQTRRFRYKRR